MKNAPVRLDASEIRGKATKKIHIKKVIIYMID